MKIAILAGETSGDNYGGLLAENIKKAAPETIILGTGGGNMRALSDIFIEMPYGTMGFSEVIQKVGSFYDAYKRVVATIEREKPSVVIFIDNPGFNLKVARAVGKKYRCVYYIPPKIWAHDYRRIKTIKKYIKVVIPIFPFENKIYRDAKIECRWFGHPVIDLITKDSRGLNRESIPAKEVPVIGLLPGSRKQEVRYLLPEFIKITKHIEKERKLQFLVSASDTEIKKAEESILTKYRAEKLSIKQDLYGIIHSSSLLLAASGTVNIEIAFMGKPLVVFYKTSPLNYRLAKMAVKVKNISPVNLMLDEKIVPEYVQFFPLCDIKKTVFDILDKGDLYHQQMKSFRILKESIGTEKVSEKVAQFILSYSE